MKKFKIGSLLADSFLGMDKKEITANLESIAYSIDKGSYTRTLTEEEIAEKKAKLSEVAILIQEIKDRQKLLNDALKAEMQEPKAIYDQMLLAIKYKTERFDGIMYSVDDQESGQMYFFDENGVCVDSRPLLPNEMQTNIFTLTKRISENG